MRSEREVAAVIVAAHDVRQTVPAVVGDEAIRAEQAYAIQALVTGTRLGRGERIVGWKLGYTSAVMREQMGIDSPNFGPLTDAMVLRDPARLPDTVTQPRVEPEVALVVGDRADQVASAHAALEIVDSVWRDYRFSWADNTADGSSAAYVVLGPELDLHRARHVSVELFVDDAAVGSGSAEAAMGDPFAALAWLREQLAHHPRGLRPGDIVITGGLTAAVPLEVGSVVRADFDGAGVEITRAP